MKRGVICVILSLAFWCLLCAPCVGTELPAPSEMTREGILIEIEQNQNEREALQSERETSLNETRAYLLSWENEIKENLATTKIIEFLKGAGTGAAVVIIAKLLIDFFAPNT